MRDAYSIFTDALDEAMQDAKEPCLKRHVAVTHIEPVRQYTASKIKEIRHRAGVTQELFARFFGVSAKTVEAWEAGRNTPSGPSSRLLGLIEDERISIANGI